MERKINYEQAVNELEKIVELIENSEVSVDQLAEKVKRASELIKICQDILKKTDAEVQDILKSMSPPKKEGSM